MIIFPDIEIQNGRSVNRIRGKEEAPEIYDISPLDAARQFVAAGAERLHVVDVDSSLSFGRFNHDIICQIIEAVDVPVQVGGGIRTHSDVAWWFDHGAARVVLGTVAVKDRHLTTEVCAHYPGQIVISITGKDGFAMIDGWRTRTSFTPLELAKSFEDSGAGAIIYADLDRFESGKEVGLASTIEMGTELNIPLISTGTVYSLDDVSTLSLLPSIEGVIIGRALFNGTVDLADAIAVGRDTVSSELAEKGVAPKLDEVSGVPLTKITSVDLYASKMELSTNFYGLLGFHPENRGAALGEPVVMNHKCGLSIRLLPGRMPPVHLTLEVESMAQTRSCLEYNLITIIETSENEASSTVMIEDPDGNRIELQRPRWSSL